MLSIKSECLNRLVPLGENHLRHAVTEFIGSIVCRERVGGVLRYYYREAA